MATSELGMVIGSLSHNKPVVAKLIEISMAFEYRKNSCKSFRRRFGKPACSIGCQVAGCKERSILVMTNVITLIICTASVSRV